MEMNRLGERNLGRDDRIVSHHGKEARYPYLDPDVVNYLFSLPIHVKCDLRLPVGQGDKLLLRLLAYQLGLHDTAVLPKRAMQFGTRSAKLNFFVCGQKKGKGIGQILLPKEIMIANGEQQPCEE